LCYAPKAYLVLGFSIWGLAKEEDEVRLSPLGYGHINMLGHYSFSLAEQVMQGKLSPLNQPSDDLDTP